MKKIVLVIVGIVIFVSVVAFQVNSNLALIISGLPQGGDLTQKELVFRANLFGVVPVAQAVLKTGNAISGTGGKLYYLTAEAKPLKIFASFFKGSVLIESYVDIKTLNPLVFRQKMFMPGKADEIKEVIYDQKNNIMTTKGVKRNVLPDTREPLSILLNLRNMDLSKVKDFEMNINTNQKNYAFKASVMPRLLRTHGKEYKLYIIKASIFRRDKNPYHKSFLDITMLNVNGKNTPILIKVVASGMFLSAKLVDLK